MRPEPIWGLFLRALRVGLRGTANGRELCSDPRTNQLVFRGCRSGVRDGGPFLAPCRKARASLEAVTQSTTEARLRVSPGAAARVSGRARNGAWTRLARRRCRYVGNDSQPVSISPQLGC